MFKNNRCVRYRTDSLFEGGHTTRSDVVRKCPIGAFRLPAWEAAIDQSTANGIIAALPSKERQRLLMDAFFFELEVPQSLGVAGKALTHAYFPTDCVISLRTPAAQGRFLEVGLVGFEGMLGAGCALGVPQSVFDAELGCAGHGWRIDVETLNKHIGRSEILRILLLRYLNVQRAQLSEGTVCGRFHTLEQRLCRWLLMNQDRQRSSDLMVTHCQLAQLVGARRSAITIEAGRLQQSGLIRYSRGHIFVINRAGLLRSTCACYEQDLAVYKKFMGTPP